MQREQWQPVMGYERNYEISSFGRMRRHSDGKGVKAGKLIKIHYDARTRNAFCTVCQDGKRSTLSIARTMLEAFAGPAPACARARYRDNRWRNLTLDNLHWNLSYGRAEIDNVDPKVVRMCNEKYHTYGAQFIAEHFSVDVRLVRKLLKAGKDARRIQDAGRMERSREIRRQRGLD